MASDHKGRNPALHFWAGFGLLAIATAASLVLALDELGAIGAVGCGRAAGCHEAAASAFGKLGFVGWPLSYVGAAWFGAALCAWIATRGDFGRIAVLLARLGGAASIFYLGVLAGRGFMCPYCIATHAANIAFLFLLGTNAHSTARATRGIPIAVATAVLVGVGLAIADARSTGAAREHSDRALAASVATVNATNATSSTATQAFTGRHRRGPESARARIVVFTDYQCPDCRALEAELEAALAHQNDVSIAVRHFPLCTECNAHAVDYHPNACWAARAAEAASIVAGDAAFWRMHAWLFARSGSFTETELDAGLAELGLDRAAFLSAMHSDETLARIREDSEIALGVGLSSTPMIFVNGVELRGFEAPGAIDRALHGVQSAPMANTTATDRPPSARERFLDEWRHAPITQLPPDEHPHVLGASSARVQIVLFGDYQEPFTCRADIELRDLALRRDDVAYSFRDYPVNRACNPAAEIDIGKLSCLAALGAEAVEWLQGHDGFWAMHDWIVTHRAEFDDATLTQAASELGMKRDDYWQAMTRPELQQWIAEDALAAKALGVQQIPLIYVAGKRVEHWTAGDESLLATIVDEAARR